MDDLTIEPVDVHKMIETGKEFLLLDCREPWEFQTAHIEGAKLIPMQEIPQNLGELPKDQPVVVYCHAGVRSYSAASWLKRQGITALSMSGGIDQWSREIDPNVPRY